MVEPRKIGRVILRARDPSGGFVAPEEDGHVWEGGRGDQLSWCSVGHLFAWAVRQLRVVNRNGCSQTRALRAANVQGG